MANIITLVRIACAFGMIFCPTFSAWFFVLYIVGGVSDVLDGIAARHFGKETAFGARLDTIADIVFAAVVVIKTVRAVSIPMYLCVWIVCIAVIKCINIVTGFVLYKRFTAEHTVMNKICGVLLFAFPLCVGYLSPQAVEVLLVSICAAATFAAVQEGYFIRAGKEIC